LRTLEWNGVVVGNLIMKGKMNKMEKWNIFLDEVFLLCGKKISFILFLFYLFFWIDLNFNGECCFFHLWNEILSKKKEFGNNCFLSSFSFLTRLVTRTKESKIKVNFEMKENFEMKWKWKLGKGCEGGGTCFGVCDSPLLHLYQIIECFLI